MSYCGFHRFGILFFNQFPLDISHTHTHTPSKNSKHLNPTAEYMACVGQTTYTTKYHFANNQRGSKIGVTFHFQHG